MKNYKALAILFTFLSFGAVSESFRIFTSAAPDIAENRKELILLAIIMTGLFVFLAIKFWQKSSDRNKIK
jgi:hypothetical protein